MKELGYGIYLLSNAKEDLPEYFPLIPGSECFDDGIISARWKLLTPQPEIYQTLLREYGLRAEECFFIDDLNINIEGAWLVGMDGACFYSSLGPRTTAATAQRMPPTANTHQAVFHIYRARPNPT